VPETLDTWVSLQAQRRSEALAVALNGEQLTYGELETLSNQIARSLRQAGCRRGDRVCLLMPKSPLAIAGIIGIYKADGVYVPLDPSSPAARLSKIIDRCDTRHMLAGGNAGAALGELLTRKMLPSGMAIGWLESTTAGWLGQTAAFSLEDVRALPPEPIGHDSRRDDAAHILFTSGSTGVPKGVVITHANVIHFIEWAVKHFGIQSSDRLSGHPPLHFDLSFLDIFGSFAAGASLHLVPAEATLLPNKLAEWIRTTGLTQWFSVPSVLQYLAKFDVVRFNDFPALKRLLWCGEVLPTSSLIYWMKRLPHVGFTNLYGPTETTIASSYYTVPQCPDDDRAAIPIGTACAGEELRVLDKDLQPVPAGESGDLYIGGVGLSPGYWRDEAKTREVFLPDTHVAGAPGRLYKTGDLARIDDDGLVYFLGRTDSQVKSRGYRIELGEIEAALNAMGVIRECAVLALPSDGFDTTTISCAYVVAEDSGATPVTLRIELEKVLPRYMIPSQWMAFGELPKNANGKIDRRYLRQVIQRNATAADQHA